MLEDEPFLSKWSLLKRELLDFPCFFLFGKLVGQPSESSQRVLFYDMSRYGKMNKNIDES